MGSAVTALYLELGGTDMTYVLFSHCGPLLSLRCPHHGEQGVCEVSLPGPQVRESIPHPLLKLSKPTAPWTPGLSLCYRYLGLVVGSGHALQGIGNVLYPLGKSWHTA